MAGRKGRYGDAADQTSADRTAPPPPRTDPVRITVDLSPEQHRALKRWCAQLVVDSDLPAVPMAEVMRILGRILTEGAEDAPGLRPVLADQVHAALVDRHQQASRARIRR